MPAPLTFSPITAPQPPRDPQVAVPTARRSNPITNYMTPLPHGTARRSKPPSPLGDDVFSIPKRTTPAPPKRKSEEVNFDPLERTSKKRELGQAGSSATTHKDARGVSSRVSIFSLLLSVVSSCTRDVLISLESPDTKRYSEEWHQMGRPQNHPDAPEAFQNTNPGQTPRGTPVRHRRSPCVLAHSWQQTNAPESSNGMAQFKVSVETRERVVTWNAIHLHLFPRETDTYRRTPIIRRRLRRASLVLENQCVSAAPQEHQPHLHDRR